jgi:Tfp pilus assembly protein PilO
VLIGITYWILEPRWKKWEERQEEMKLLRERMQVTAHLLEQKDKWEEKFVRLRDELPRYPAGRQVTAELLKNIEQTARRHNLTLLRREPEKPEDMGDLYEVAIHCTWDSELEPLTHFLYAIQIQGAILDIRNLSVTPMKGAPGRLKGSFTVDCAFTREQEQDKNDASN